ncbi:probable glutathione peroxidase 8 isoform X1 [Pteropus alecto]|uniref:Glutathione peroxidase n=1 Tax=Pteropus vampyrus TaxID=132908 RepID=A0A6P3RE57_PTEVA|nr:probable glutathione peroxidase 8 isoform X1 [Pteropus vampyrus]XP_015445313.1 probable glutathione peroxidase 8 isoform X1 [Pteropus alecto]XP_015997824.1 probable glutathione peroxidase 8 isoform X1 [Rousettus aegyptiacus]XP_039725873.1 probable glutathione peroxidase 8 isoform X1 [Pteropus giganteus]
MEPLTAYPLRCSGPKTKVFAVLLSMVLCTVMLFLLQLKFLKPKINSFYTFEVKDAKGRPVSLEKFKGKEVTLVVNVASDCQLTDRNYLALQELHKEFGPFHFSVLAFPCNQFGESEPRPSKEVVSFARNNYGVTFPIFHKIKILGPEAEPAFRFLVDSSKKEPRWNFWKYLVNPEGQVLKSWRPEESIEVIRPEIADLIRQMIIKKREDL